MNARPISKSLTWLGTTTAHPAAFLVVVSYGLLWLLLQPDTFDMHGVATLIVWPMTPFIQRAEHRDTQALHAKIDELLKAIGGARKELIDIDAREPEEIERHREGK